jgi:NADH dehydrogenase FAD-containing subunit
MYSCHMLQMFCTSLRALQVPINALRVYVCVTQGLMAYVGSDQAITQFEAGKASFSLAGYLSFLLWRSVYITKQVR